METKAEHYFSKHQSSELDLTKIKVFDFELWSGNGVFSKKKLDNGTKVMLKYSDFSDCKKVLDLGCGIGVVGIFIKKNYPEKEVVCTDINERAVMLTKKNAKELNLDITVKESDGFENIDETFDCILLNPPMSAGKKVVEKLIKESSDHLVSKGKMYVVVKNKKGGSILKEIMQMFFSKIEVVGKGSGYIVIESRKQ